MSVYKPTILCLSRSYLAKLLPTIGSLDDKFEYVHIVQTDAEERLVRSLGGIVVLNIQSTVRQAFKGDGGADWQEPADFRECTEFDWSAVYSDRYLVNLPGGVRSRVAGALQSAVGRLFQERQFVGFLSEPVALFITHLIFYHCRQRNVRTLLWCNTYFSDYFYFASRMEISQPVRSVPMDGEDLRALESAVGEFVDGIVEDRRGPVYHHAFVGARQGVFSYFKQRRGESALVLRPGWVSRGIQVIRLLRAVWHRLSFRWTGDFMIAGAVREHWFYLRCLFARKGTYDKPPTEFSEENVVYPLQYEPEASLLYFAPHIVSQISLVETILRSLPDSKVLWVKEHPNQFGALGAASWRALRRRHHNLRIVHGRENGRRLIKMSSLVVTISSSMGMDALLLGRRVLVLGRVFYSTFSGAVRVDAYQDLARELNRPASYVVQKNLLECKKDLVEFGRLSYKGDPQPSHYLYEKANLAHLIAAIRSEVLL